MRSPYLRCLFWNIHADQTSITYEDTTDQTRRQTPKLILQSTEDSKQNNSQKEMGLEKQHLEIST